MLSYLSVFIDWMNLLKMFIKEAFVKRYKPLPAIFLVKLLNPLEQLL